MCLSIAISRPDDVLAKGDHLGFQWVVTHNGCGYRCGYVRVPLGHPWHGASLELDVCIHGGITFSEPDVPCEAPGPDTDWWLGFDCAHCGDAPDPTLSAVREPLVCYAGVVRDQSYVEGQCLLLCEQAAAVA